MKRHYCTLLVAAIVTLLAAVNTGAQELRVMTSGAFRAALLQLVPDFERATGNRIVTIIGASLGTGPTTAGSRQERRCRH